MKKFVKLLALLLLLPLGSVTASTAPADVPVTLVIDAGHGEPDGGASSPGGVSEQSVNLCIARKVRSFCDFIGIRSMMTRNNENSIHSSDAQTIREKKISDLKNRLAFVQGLDNPVFLSIHLNFFEQTQYHGAQVFYSPNHADGKPLAEVLQKALHDFLDPDNERKAKPATNDVYLLKQLECPAVIVECGFLSNPEESALLINDAYQNRIAFSMTAGVLQYLHNRG